MMTKLEQRKFTRDFLHEQQNDPEFIRSFAEWLTEVNDALPEPDSFFEWIERHEDAI